MKKFSSNVLMLLISVAIQSQTIPFGENISLDQQLQNISRTTITSEIIYERVLSSANLYNFNKVNTFNTANFPYFKQVLSEMNRASNNTKFITLSAFKNLVASTTVPNQVDVSILNTQFHILNYNEDNPSRGGLTYNTTTNKFVSITGQAPFYMMHNTIIAPTKDFVSGSNVIYKMRNDLYFKNGTKTIKTLVADFGDGINRPLITNSILTNQNITVKYSTSGEKISKYIITYNDNSTLTTYGKIYYQKLLSTIQTPSISMINPPVGSCFTADPLKQDFNLQADIPFTGYSVGDPTIKAKIEYRIFYHKTNQDGSLNISEKKVVKPIIIIDGFDPGDKRKIEDCDCENIPSCASRNTTNGIYNPQKHKAMVDLMEYYEGSDKRELMLKLRTEGYDVIVVNQPNYTTTNLQNGQTVSIDGGAYYVESNAMALIKLLQLTKTSLVANGSVNNIAIVAPSMAGQISKYALSYMEKKFAETGLTSWKHNTSLWISVDSPHLGSNIPMGDQAMLYLLKEGGIDAAGDFYDKELSSPAAQQLLIEFHRPGSNYNTVNQNMLNAQTISQNMSSNEGNSMFQQHYNNQFSNGLPNSKGWPQNLRKISLVNGSLTGSKQTQTLNGSPFIPFANDGEKVFNYRGFQRVHLDLPWPLGSITFRTHIVSLESNFMPSFGMNARIARFKKLLDDKTTQSPNLNLRGCMDNAPGGYFDAQAQISDQTTSQDPVPGVSLTALNNWSLNNLSLENIFKSISEILGGSEWYRHEYNPIHSFIPSFSAIGHLQPNQNWSNPINTNLTCLTNKLTPFDSYFGLANNTQHTSFTKESVDWLLKELAGNPQAPIFPLQKNLIYGPDAICENTTYTFSDVCKLPSANVVWAVYPNSQLVSSTPNSVTINGALNNEVLIRATFSNGQSTVKKVWAGAPSTLYYVAKPSKCKFEYTPQYVDLTANYQWEYINGSGGAADPIEMSLSQTGNKLIFYAYSDFNIQLKLTVTNNCGTEILYINDNHVIDPNPPFCAYQRIANSNINTTFYKIYPNPTSNIVNVEIKDQEHKPDLNAVINAELYNMIGELKQNVIITNNIASINVAGLPLGIYLLKINIDGVIESHQLHVE